MQFRYALAGVLHSSTISQQADFPSYSALLPTLPLLELSTLPHESGRTTLSIEVLFGFAGAHNNKIIIHKVSSRCCPSVRGPFANNRSQGRKRKHTWSSRLRCVSRTCRCRRCRRRYWALLSLWWIWNTVFGFWVPWWWCSSCWRVVDTYYWSMIMMFTHLLEKG